MKETLKNMFYVFVFVELVAIMPCAGLAGVIIMLKNVIERVAFTTNLDRLFYAWLLLSMLALAVQVVAYRDELKKAKKPKV